MKIFTCFFILVLFTITIPTFHQPSQFSQQQFPKQSKKMGNVCTKINDYVIKPVIKFTGDALLGICAFVNKFAPAAVQTIIPQRTVHNPVQIQEIDHVLATRGNPQMVTLDRTQVSREGIHHYRMNDDQLLPLAVERKIHEISKEPYYTIYSLAHSTQDEFLQHVRQVTDRLNIDRHHAIINYNQVSSRDIAAHELVGMQRVLRLPMSREQSRIVDFIIKRHVGVEKFNQALQNFNNNNNNGGGNENENGNENNEQNGGYDTDNESVVSEREFIAAGNENPRIRLTTSIMLTGIPGTGKSSVASYVTMRYRQLFPQENVMLVYGFDPTVPCLNIIHHVIQQRPHQSDVLVLVLDEFDRSIEYALRDTSGEGFPQSSHARNKQQLTGFLDLLNNNMPNSIVIGTSNREWEELQGLESGAFVRPGRFNHHFKMTQQHVG